MDIKYLSSFSPKVLGTILGKIVDAGTASINERELEPLPGISFEKLISELDEVVIEQLKLLLDLLQFLGFITINNDRVIHARNRYAHFTLASLSKFMSANVEITRHLGKERTKKYIVAYTKALEEARLQSKDIDQKPIHSRKIVNIVIPRRQLRAGKLELVYLCILHDEWRQFHLVGVSDQGDSEKSDSNLIKIALKEQLNLEQNQYKILEGFSFSDNKIEPEISETNGALTKYEYQVYAMRDITVPDLNKHLLQLSNNKENDNLFRWFTIDEAREKRRDKDKIMNSTHFLLEHQELKDILASTKRPITKDLIPPRSISSFLGSQVPRSLFVFLGVVLLLSVISSIYLFFQPYGNPINLITSISSLFTTVLSFVILLYKSKD